MEPMFGEKMRIRVDNLFKFHYVQMELKKEVVRNERDNKAFKFHYVQMEPPLLTFQTSFNKA